MYHPCPPAHCILPPSIPPRARPWLPIARPCPSTSYPPRALAQDVCVQALAQDVCVQRSRPCAWQPPPGVLRAVGWPADTTAPTSGRAVQPTTCVSTVLCVCGGGGPISGCVQISSGVGDRLGGKYPTRPCRRRSRGTRPWCMRCRQEPAGARLACPCPCPCHRCPCPCHHLGMARAIGDLWQRQAEGHVRWLPVVCGNGRVRGGACTWVMDQIRLR